MHCIGKHQTMNPLTAFCHKTSAAQDCISPGICHADMLRIFSVCFHLNPLTVYRSKRLCICFGKFLFRHFILFHNELVMFHYEFGTIHLDFQSVGTMRISGGCDKHTGRSVCIFHVCGNIIFYLNLVPLTKMHKRTYLYRHSANPLPQIQLMRTLV